MNKIAAILAVVLGLGGFLLLQRHQAEFEDRVAGGEPVPVVVATRDIPLGGVITEDAIAIRELPEKYLEERHVLATDAQRILGVRVSLGVSANASILWTDLATASVARRDLSGMVQEGKRAVTVRASASSTFGGLLRPGDRVDVLLTTERGEGAATVPLLQNVLVLAVGRNLGAPSAGQMGEVQELVGSMSPDVTLSVTLLQAQALTHADQRGHLTVVLRNPDDVAVVSNPPETTDADIEMAERLARLQSNRKRSTSDDKSESSTKEIERVTSDR